MRRICTVSLQSNAPRTARTLKRKVVAAREEYRVRRERTVFHQVSGTLCENASHDRRVCSPDLGAEAEPRGPIAIGIARMFHRWSDTPKPSPAQLTALRRLQSDLGPLLASIDVIPNQTNDPALIQAAERVHDALRGLLAEMAVVIYRARRPSAEVSNSMGPQPGGSR
jgi:hypothetical protein